MTNKKSSLSKKLNNKSSKKPRVDKPSSLPQEGRYDGGGNSGDFSDDLSSADEQEAQSGGDSSPKDAAEAAAAINHQRRVDELANAARDGRRERHAAQESCGASQHLARDGHDAATADAGGVRDDSSESDMSELPSKCYPKEEALWPRELSQTEISFLEEDGHEPAFYRPGCRPKDGSSGGRRSHADRGHLQKSRGPAENSFS